MAEVVCDDLQKILTTAQRGQKKTLQVDPCRIHCWTTSFPQDCHCIRNCPEQPVSAIRPGPAKLLDSSRSVPWIRFLHRTILLKTNSPTTLFLSNSVFPSAQLFKKIVSTFDIGHEWRKRRKVRVTHFTDNCSILILPPDVDVLSQQVFKIRLDSTWLEQSLSSDFIPQATQ